MRLQGRDFRRAPGSVCALVLGVNGQDGSFIAECLLERGYSVCGVGRQSSSRYLQNQEKFIYVSCDLSNAAALRELLYAQSPTLIFHFAAVHGPSGFNYEPVAIDALMINLVSVQVILDYLRSERSEGFLVYASSSKVFATPLPGQVTEDSPKVSSCLYSYTKNAASDLISMYRLQYGVCSSILYMFQHESIRRSPSYFIPRVCGILRSARDGCVEPGHVTTLDFYCDWGCAKEYAEITAEIALNRTTEDFVLASGVTWHARQLVHKLFRHYGLDWSQYIIENYSESGCPEYFQVVVDKLGRLTGRRPQKNILDVCHQIVSG